MSRVQFLLACLLAIACGGDVQDPHSGPTDIDNGYAPPAGAKAEFSVLPVSSPGTLEPLGHLAPPGHTLPTDHIYFYAVDYDHFGAADTITRPVYAPATGVVSFRIKPVGTDSKVQFVVTKDFGYYLDHILPLATVQPGVVFHAGDLVGYTNPGGSIDLGAYDLSVPAIPYANQKRYAEYQLHCVNPMAYFVEPLRSQLYARQRRLPTATPDAPVNFDVKGRLSGNWFEQSVPDTSYGDAQGPNGWPKELAFVYDNRDPSQPRVSIGGTIATQGIWTIDPDAPRFETISPASGTVSYRLRYTESTNVQSGVMLVQMLADDRLKVEVFEGSSETLAATAAFDNKAFIYVR
jgi:hypothetical protein